MKRRPSRDDDGDSNDSTESSDVRNAKLLKRIALVFGGVIVVAVLITVIALMLSN